MRKHYFMVSIIYVCAITFIAYAVTHSFFSNDGPSTSNIYAASQTFPSATPTPTLPITPTVTPPVPIAQTLVINELLPLSSCNAGQTNGQYLELWNGSGVSVDLQNFKLSDGTNTIAIANSNTSLPNGAFAVLVKSTGVINQCLGNSVNGAVTVNLGGTIDLNVGLLRLLAADNSVIDTLQWGTAPLQPSTDQSLERVPTGRDSATGSAFNASDFIVKELYTPGYGTILVLNEFLPNPNVLFTDEWVEIYNPGNTLISLNGWTLKDLALTARSLTSLGNVSSLGRVTFDDVGDAWLNNSGSETLQLIDNTGKIIDQHTFSGTSNDVSIGRQTDAFTTWKNCTAPTKNTSNNGSC